jgi:hypothetical protein
MMDALPRADISGQITSALIAQLSNADWKERQAAIKTVSDILAACPRITPALGGLLSALKARLAESNKNMVQSVLGTSLILEIFFRAHLSCAGADSRTPCRDSRPHCHGHGQADRALDQGSGWPDDGGVGRQQEDRP